MLLIAGIIGAVLLLVYFVWKSSTAPRELLVGVVEGNTYKIGADISDAVYAEWSPNDDPSTCGMDVTDVILANKGARIAVESDTFGPDPCPGIKKALRIYSHR